MSTHTLNFPGADINTTQLTVGTGGLAVNGNVLRVDPSASRVGIGTATPQYSLDVLGDFNFSGDIYQGGTQIKGTPWTIETSPDALSYTSGNVGIGAANPGATLEVTGNAYISSNLDVYGDVLITGGLSTNTGGVKKLYSFSGDLGAGQTIADSTIKITFSAHVFYAKIVAHLIESEDEVSTLSMECGGGHWTGGTPLSIAKGPVGIFGSASTNPWSSTITTSTTEVSFKPTTDMAVAGHYNVFIEYMSHNSSGKVTKITEGSTDVVTFGY